MWLVFFLRSLHFYCQIENRCQSLDLDREIAFTFAVFIVSKFVFAYVVAVRMINLTRFPSSLSSVNLLASNANSVHEMAWLMNLVYWQLCIPQFWNLTLINIYIYIYIYKHKRRDLMRKCMRSCQVAL